MNDKSKPERFWLVRNLFLLALSLIPLVLLAQWGMYRMDHTVSSDATIQGNVAVVGARLNGRLAEVSVQSNQFLRAGDVIGRLEDEHLRASLREAEVEKSRAEQQIELERMAMQQARRELDLALSRAEADLVAATSRRDSAQKVQTIAEREHRRVNDLSMPTAVSESEKDAVLLRLKQAEFATITAEGDVRAKHLALDEARAKLEGLAILERRVNLLRKDVDLAQAKMERVKADIDATIIRSPVDGWVGSRIAGAGTSVRVGDPIVSVLENGPLWIDAWVRESALGQLEVGQTVDVRLRAHPDSPTSGTVEAIGVLSNHEQVRHSASALPLLSTENKVGVRIAIDRGELRLMPGLTAVIGIQSPDADSTEVLAKLRNAVEPISTWFQAL